MAEPKTKRVVPAGWLPDLLAGAPPPAARAAAPAARASSGDLALVRRILAARPLADVAELDAGLAEAARGEAALVAWLARPAEKEALDADPLDVLRANLAQIGRSLKALPPGSKVNASVYNSITSAVKAIEGIMAKRPREPTKDEIEARIADVADEARRKICEYTDDARDKLAADRAELSAWGRSVLGPVGGAELDRRVAAMFGEDVA
jgi:antitoxin component HigA of HigAB toxin-antitoxin module